MISFKTQIFIVLWSILMYANHGSSQSNEHTKICVIMLGYPGSGKGASAQSLSKDGFISFSFGDFLRTQVRKKTSIGEKYQKEIEMKGLKKVELLPEDFVEKLFYDKIVELSRESPRIILDGFPKTVQQAIFLEKLLKDLQIDPIYVHFFAPKEILMDRIVNRRVCGNCGHIYNVKYDSPISDQICDFCSEYIYIRSTDTFENTQLRFAFFDEIMEPLLAFYRDRKQLEEIDASLPIHETLAQFRGLLIRKKIIQ